MTPHDRWTAYLGEYERALGRPLSSKMFDRLIAGADLSGEPVPDLPEADDGVAAFGPMSDGERRGWRTWIGRAVDKVAPGDGPPARLMVRVLIGRLFVRLLGQGVWDLGDGSWREPLARLTGTLQEQEGDEVPGEALDHLAALAAVCTALVRQDASLTGTRPADRVAQETWAGVRDFVAMADARLAEDLLMPPTMPRAVVVTRTDVETVIEQALDDDPDAAVTGELAEHGLDLDREDGLYLVSGSFSNPVPIAARAATLLGRHHETVLVQARSAGKWAFIAWRRPNLLLASAPAGYAWRLYRIAEPATPESRLGVASDGLPATGLVGRPMRLGQIPPEGGVRLLDSVGVDHVDLLRRLID
ncbi:hypothetical protein [Spongiactinospora sp. TRM90649]|uniref:hypothetical protein n=1 Tax=Spongiactinospora sp. TRM90649 TaxID=3031114 RepID=UPI0023F72FF8|nr:hypothetical protein [Spongiactinospora sp. TRM90649]MDF5756285.1 hypothetical protein [Spongiactinospora sp. TRM90649]